MSLSIQYMLVYNEFEEDYFFKAAATIYQMTT